MEHRSERIFFFEAVDVPDGSTYLDPGLTWKLLSRQDVLDSFGGAPICSGLLLGFVDWGWPALPC